MQKISIGDGEINKVFKSNNLRMSDRNRSAIKN